MVSLQVEHSRENVWVPNGLAVPIRNYEPDGLTFTATDSGGLAFTKDTLYRNDATRDARIFASTRTNWVINAKNDDNQKATVIGPVLAQTRTAIPVHAGMKVNFAGEFRLRKQGLHNQAADGQYRGQDVRVAVWGTGTSIDEYGVESTVTIELLAWQTEFQPYDPFVAPNGDVSFTLPTVSDATVPPGVDRIYLSVSLIAQVINQPHAGQYQSFWWGALDTDFLSFPKSAPLRLFVRRPEVASSIPVPTPLSHTGCAFPNRTRFDNLPIDSEVVLVSTSAVAVTVAVHEWDTARGALLVTVDLPPGGRVSTPVHTTTGRIELVASGNFGVERVAAQNITTETYEQNAIYRYQFTDVIDDVASIAAESIEADLALMTVKFSSNVVSSILRAGKRVRLLAKHSEGFTQVYSGVIRNRRTVHRIGRPDQVEIVIHSAHGTIGQVQCPVAYDQLEEFGPLVNTAGVPIVIDGVDYTGPARRLPDGWNYFPSYSTDSGQSMYDALMLARNTRKGYVFVDRHDRVVIAGALPNGVVAELSDTPGEGDMSYNSREFESGADTANIINSVIVEEHLLDRTDFVDRKLEEEPAPNLFGDIKSRTRRVEYRRDASIDVFGLQRKTFGVIRGTGKWVDIVADRYGATFEEWASAVLDEYSGEGPAIDKIRLTVINESDLRLIAGLQALDALAVTYKGQRFVRHIRRLEHTIVPNKWIVDIRFDAVGDQNLWLPPAVDRPELEPALVEGEAGLIDGGRPEDTGPGVIDGGDQNLPPVEKVTHNVSFDQPNGLLDADWIYRNTPAVTPVVRAGELVMTNSTGGLAQGYVGRWFVTYVPPVNTDNQEVSGRLTSAPTASFQALMLGMNDTMTSGVMVEWNRSQVIVSAILGPNSRMVRRQGDVETAFTATNRARFRREGDRYRFYRDDSLLFEWTDPGGFAVVGGKHAGAMVSRDAPTNSAGFDDFQFKDI